MEQAIVEVGERISELLDRHVPRPSGNIGLTCVAKQLQSRTAPDGTVTPRWSFEAQDIALALLHPQPGAYENGYRPSLDNKAVLFKVTLNTDGEPRFNNFVTSYFPAVREAWRKMIASEGSLTSTVNMPMHLQTPNRWQHLEELMSHFAAALGTELAAVGLPDTPVTRARLISVRLALGGGLMSGRLPEEALPTELVPWLAADIDLQVLLYAFDTRRSWTRSTSNKPLVPFEDALELRGVPLANIRALYPQEEPPRWH